MKLPSWKAIGGMFVAATLIGWMVPKTPEATAGDSKHVETAADSPTPAPPEPGSQWRDWSSEDAMGRKRTILTVPSSNTLSFKFPYQGEQHAALTLRKSAAGTDILVAVERGQFMCHIGGCSVNVRFDDGPVKRIAASAPNDSSSNAIFLSGEAGLIAQMKKSTTARIEATFYQEGSQVMEFQTEGLKWPR